VDDAVDLSLLRVLDIVLWMSVKGERPVSIKDWPRSHLSWSGNRQDAEN
jgi:hypothetical protein